MPITDRQSSLGLIALTSLNGSSQTLGRHVRAQREAHHTPSKVPVCGRGRAHPQTLYPQTLTNLIDPHLSSHILTYTKSILSSLTSWRFCEGMLPVNTAGNPREGLQWLSLSQFNFQMENPSSIKPSFPNGEPILISKSSSLILTTTIRTVVKSLSNLFPHWTRSAHLRCYETRIMILKILKPEPRSGPGLGRARAGAMAGLGPSRKTGEPIFKNKDRPTDIFLKTALFYESYQQTNEFAPK